MKVVWSAEAERALDEVVALLHAARPSASLEFLEAVEGALRLASGLPEINPSVRRHPGVRRALIRKFRYWVIYEVDEEQPALVVLNLWPTYRSPSGWKRRHRRRRRPI